MPQGVEVQVLSRAQIERSESCAQEAQLSLESVART